ncbi:MAG: lactate racemase domain-containing protein [Bacteroidales bacterium]
MVLFAKGAENYVLSIEEMLEGISSALQKIQAGRKILVVPPDFTRYHSMAGAITVLLHKLLGDRITDILPALGTHAPMTAEQRGKMFPGIPSELFRVHDFRKDTVHLGDIPAEFISSITGGLVNYSWPAEINRLVANGGHNLIISVGQVVPHEVIGMAGYNKNILIGTGGSEAINRSHFIGAVYGMERIMGRTENPVRTLLNKAADSFLSSLPILYILTVIGRDEKGKLVPRGLFIGTDNETFEMAADLSRLVNFTIVDDALRKVVVWLDPSEYRSTWLGNKAIYRTRMAMADDGELIIIAPGVREFGEDREIDRLIRKYGYNGTLLTLRAVDHDPELRENLSAAAHLIHGSTEGRFNVTWCPGGLSRKEIESAGYRYDNCDEIMRIFRPQSLKEGFNNIDPDGEIFFISNPATGLWASSDYLSK